MSLSIRSAIKSAVRVEGIPDPKPTAASLAEQREAELKKEDVLDRQADRKGRVELVPKLVAILQIWMIGTLFILLWQGWSAKLGFFHLSDSVLVTLLTTTTANVIGLFAIAAKYYFSEKRVK